MIFLEEIEFLKQNFSTHIREKPPSGEDPYWNKQVETMPRDEIERLQLGLLTIQIKRVYQKNMFFHEQFKRSNLTPEDIKSLKDLKRIPLMSKDDVRARMNPEDPTGGMLIVPFEKLRMFHTSTGTTGLRTFFAETTWDLEWTRELMCRILWTAGVRPEKLFANFFGAAEVWHGGARNIHRASYYMGAICVSGYSGAGPETELERNYQILRYLKPRVIFYPFAGLTFYKEFVERKGVDPKESVGNAETIITAGDVVTSAIVKDVKDYWGFKRVCSAYQMGDTWLSGVSCPETHPNEVTNYEDTHIVECVDPETGEEVAEGERGVLVVTTLVSEAMPYLRWNMEDYVSLMREKCVCGRTHCRTYWYGRVAFALNVRGKIIFPSIIEEELYRLPEIGSKAIKTQFVKTSPTTQDKLIVRIPPIKEKVIGIEDLKSRVKETLEKKLNIPIEIEVMSEDEVEKMSMVHKLIRVVKRY